MLCIPIIAGVIFFTGHNKEKIFTGEHENSAFRKYWKNKYEAATD